uniref:Uncharacterized protein n=1 Tax=Oryza sativa subsp. japonica TaxID=39947 RepID=Q5Z7E3_ORYSJ|nr:hypothetical protein [Oryza sativa Japonica Group]
MDRTTCAGAGGEARRRRAGGAGGGSAGPAARSGKGGMGGAAAPGRRGRRRQPGCQIRQGREGRRGRRRQTDRGEGRCGCGRRREGKWPRPDGGCGLHLCRLCRRHLQPCLRFRLRPRQPAATYTSTSASASPRLLATNTTEASLTSATDSAEECLFEILHCLPGGIERGASTCVSRRWFVMEDFKLSASVPLL